MEICDNSNYIRGLPSFRVNLEVSGDNFFASEIELEDIDGRNTVSEVGIIWEIAERPTIFAIRAEWGDCDVFKVYAEMNSARMYKCKIERAIKRIGSHIMQ